MRVLGLFFLLLATPAKADLNVTDKFRCNLEATNFTDPVQAKKVLESTEALIALEVSQLEIEPLVEAIQNRLDYWNRRDVMGYLPGSTTDDEVIKTTGNLLQNSLIAIRVGIHNNSILAHYYGTVKYSARNLRRVLERGGEIPDRSYVIESYVDSYYEAVLLKKFMESMEFPMDRFKD